MSYTKKLLSNGRFEILEDGKPISNGSGFDASYANTLVPDNATLPETPPVQAPAAPAALPTEEQAPATGLVGFANKLDAVVNIAKKKRNELSLDIMAPYRGTVAASDFNGILGNLNRASDTFAQDAVKRAIELDTPKFENIQDASGALYQVKTDPKTGEMIGEPKLIFAGKPASTGGTGNNNQMTDNERALFTAFRGEPIVKDYNTMLQKKLSVDSILKAGVGGPGELALVFEFMKALDPTSVVRETEYANAAKSGNIFAGAFARFNGYLKEEGGFLPPQVQSAFQQLINAKFDVQTGLYDNTAQEYRDLAERQGLNPDNVVIGYNNAARGNAPTPISSGTTKSGLKYEVLPD